MTVPDVSVVIPTHGRREQLARMLACVLAQEAVDLEVVVVDDGSPDDTWDYLRTHPDDRVRPVHNDVAAGHAAARNRGIEAARGDWLAFADDDDLWAPNKLRLQLDAVRSDPSVGWVCVGAVEVDEDLTILGWEACPDPREGRELLVVNTVPGGGSGVMARRGLVQEVGGFDPQLRIGADYDLWIRLWLHSRFATVDRPLVAHVVHANTVTRRAGGRREAYERLREKYASARHAHGVDEDPSVLVQYADGLVASGARLAGARLYAHAGWRYHRPHLSVKAAVATVAPALLHRRWRRATAAQLATLPPMWGSDAHAWLRPWAEGG